MPNSVFYLNDWRYNLAVISSRLSLGLLNGDEINFLMDNGYYDDLMLEIIDDDPIYPKANYTKIFEKIWLNFNFPTLTNHHAKLINTFERLYPFSVRPHNILPLLDNDCFDNNNSFYDHFYDLIDIVTSDEIYFNITPFQDLLYNLDDSITYYQTYQLNQSLLFDQFHQFFRLCENWLDKHQSQLTQILAPFAQLKTQLQIHRYDPHHFSQQSHYQTRQCSTHPAPHSQKKRTNGHRRRAFVGRLFGTRLTGG